MASEAVLTGARPGPGRLGRRARQVLHSRRVAVAVMGVMAAVLALSTLVPDPASLDAEARAELAERRPWLSAAFGRLQPAQVASHPLFLLLPGYVILGVLESLRLRIRAWRAGRRRAFEAGRERFKVERVLSSVPPTPDAVASVLRGAGYEVTDASEGLTQGRRGKAGFAGSIAFHVALLLVLAGVMVSARTRLGGELLLAEGFPVPFEPGSMLTLSGAERFPALPGHTVAIRDFMAEYSDVGTPVDYSVLVAVQDGGRTVAEQQVRVNQGLDWNGFQLTLHRYGFAPEVVVVDPQGRVRQKAVSVLQLIPPGKQDSIPLEGGGQLRVQLAPDYATVEGKVANRSLQPIRPVLLFQWLSGGRKLLAEGRVERGGRTIVGGYTVAFPSLSYWAGFVVSRDEGVWLFAAGSLLGTVGLVLRLLWPDQSVRVSWDASGTRVLAATRFFPALHEDEVGRLVARLQAAGGSVEGGTDARA